MEDLGRVYEEIKVRAMDLVDKVKGLIQEGNVRRVIIKDDHGVTYMEIPLTVATVSVIAAPVVAAVGAIAAALSNFRVRSEEHTSELQSPDHLVCRLLLEKKKNHNLQLTTTALMSLVEQRDV